MIENDPSKASTNRAAIFSVLAAALTLLSLCVALAPVPFTGVICFPATLVFGGLAFFTGLAPLRQIRSRGQNGRPLALAGTAIGGLAAVAAVCMMAFGILLLPQILVFVRHLAH